MLILILIVLLGVLTGAVVLVYSLGYRADKEAWNGGKCRKCGERLFLEDEDSQGGKCYICEGCYKFIWISYDVEGGAA